MADGNQIDMEETDGFFHACPVCGEDLKQLWAWLDEWRGIEPSPDFKHKVWKKLRALEQQSSKLDALMLALDSRDHQTGNHSKRVAAYALFLSRTLAIPKDESNAIYDGALLHDVGKIGIPDSILLKPGQLTCAEQKKMQQHTQIGAGILRGLGFPTAVWEIALYHQERYDGTGYPTGLKEEEIPIGAKIVALVDTFDAIMNDRPYRKARSYSVARREIDLGTGKQFDPEFVEAFLSIPIEVWQKLSDDPTNVDNTWQFP